MRQKFTPQDYYKQPLTLQLPLGRIQNISSDAGNTTRFLRIDFQCTGLQDGGTEPRDGCAGGCTTWYSWSPSDPVGDGGLDGGSSTTNILSDSNSVGPKFGRDACTPINPWSAWSG
jgi:hypothetical protein